MKRRGLRRVSLLAGFLCLLTIALSGCGKTTYFANRTLPPSGISNRVLMAIQNPGTISKGALQIVDAYYDIRHSYNDKIAGFTITGFSGSLPQTIQNLPEQQIGLVYSVGDGSLSVINYQTEAATSSTSAASLGGISASIFGSSNLQYIGAAVQPAHSLSLIDHVSNVTAFLNIPGIYRVSMNSSATLLLAFVENTNDVFTIVHLTAPQQTAAAASPDPQHYALAGQPAQDCQPESLPVYCAYKVQTAEGASFDRPVKALFSADGSSAYVLNCGGECGGSQSSMTIIPITADSLNANASGPAGVSLVAQTTIPIPGGVTNALQSGSTLYLAGQSLLPDGYQQGNLTILNLTNNQITGTYPISDGTHNKMALADDNTLWIGSSLCQTGERVHQVNQGATLATGCLTMFNTANNTVTVDSYKGDATGIAAVISLHKIYTAEGGQVHIYNTSDGTERDNSQVTVAATVYDVAYMDALSNSVNTTY